MKLFEAMLKCRHWRSPHLDLFGKKIWPVTEVLAWTDLPGGILAALMDGDNGIVAVYGFAADDEPTPYHMSPSQQTLDVRNTAVEWEAGDLPLLLDRLSVGDGWADPSFAQKLSDARGMVRGRLEKLRAGGCGIGWDVTNTSAGYRRNWHEYAGMFRGRMHAMIDKSRQRQEAGDGFRRIGDLCMEDKLSVIMALEPAGGASGPYLHVVNDTAGTVTELTVDPKRRNGLASMIVSGDYHATIWRGFSGLAEDEREPLLGELLSHSLVRRVGEDAISEFTFLWTSVAFPALRGARVLEWGQGWRRNKWGQVAGRELVVSYESTASAKPLAAHIQFSHSRQGSNPYRIAVDHIGPKKTASLLADLRDRPPREKETYKERPNDDDKSNPYREHGAGCPVRMFGSAEL